MKKTISLLVISTLAFNVIAQNTEYFSFGLETIKRIGYYDQNGTRTGTWKMYYDNGGGLVLETI